MSRPDGMHPSISDTDYHADRDALSSTGARLLLPPSTPAHFKQWRDNPPMPKPDYTIGHVVHMLVLGKGVDIVEVDAADWRTKAAREAREEAHIAGKAPVLSHELAECRKMAAAVLTHPIAGPIFLDPRGDSEVSFYATDPETGVRLRARVDWLHYGDKRGNGRLTLVDFKTSKIGEPQQFARREAAAYGYHIQEAFYRHVVDTLKLAVDPRFLFVVVEKQPPYLVSIVEFDMPSINEGRRKVREAIDTYHHCTTNDDWPGYGDDVTLISLPDWALEDEMVIA